MKNVINALAVVSLLTLSLPGCLTLRDDVEEANTKKQVQAQVSTMQKGHAETESRIDQLEGELRQLNGRIESLEHKISVLNENDGKQDQAARAKQEEMISQMKVFEEEIAKLQQTVTEMKSEMVAKVSTSPKEGADSKGGIEEADEFFSAKSWKKAITAYNRYIEKNPKGKKVPEATYKIGVCFQELGMKAEARTFYKEVVAKFPKDPSAHRATFRLNQMKK